jgi:ATP-dependent helicase/DNAse subunit B
MRLIRGAAGAGKTALVFREFKEALRTSAAETDLRIVVPTATLVRHFQHELARDGAVFSPRCIVSLHRFARELAPEFNLVPDGLLRALVRDALRRLNLPEFAGVATTEGMTSTVIDTIGLFENADCTPDRLVRVRKLGPRAQAFEKIWRAVDEGVRDRGYATRADLMRAAASNAQPARIWMDGFLDFSPLETTFIRALSKVCDLTLTASDSRASDDIRKLCLHLEARESLLPGLSRKPATTLIEAATPEREADDIARRIVELHAHGKPFREIGVALRDTETWLSLLRATFDRFGIPARFYFSGALRRHPAAIFLGGLIEGALTGWDFETTIDALRAHPRWGRSAAFDRFDFAVRKAMPGRGADALLALCDADWLREEISKCLRTDLWKSERQAPAAWKWRFERLAATLYRPGTLDAPRNHADVAAARSHIAAVRSWAEAIQMAVPFWRDQERTIPLDEFWRIVDASIESAVFQPADERADVVHVMNVYEARQWDLASLFVCGLKDTDFPRRHPRNLLFTSSEIDRLHAAGIPLRTADDRNGDRDQDEEWLFESLRTRATKSLFLSCPRNDATGKSVTPSRFVLRLGLNAEPAPLCRPIPNFETPDFGVAGHLDSPALLAQMAAMHKQISPTALEDLAQCRFKFFAGRTLALDNRPDRPGERLQRRVTGIILHEALDRWLAGTDRDFVELFDEVFAESCGKCHLPPGYRLEVERILNRKIAGKVSANDKWKPDSSESEVKLTLDFPGGIAVNCRLDRIDRFGSNCVIVDYKSSKTENVKKLVHDGTKLQGPLYCLAVREHRNLNPVAMVYWAVRDDELYGWGAIPNYDADLDPMPANWATDARARAIGRLSGYLAGAVEARPENPDQCRWCDFRDACRVEQHRALVKIGGAVDG